MYDRALKLQPSHAPAHMFRAMALLCQGDIKAAESGLRRSNELDPLSASDCARMAYLHYVKGDYPSAAEHLRQSFELDRDYPEARFYEGLLHFQQQRYDAVIQSLSPSDFPLDIGLLAAAHAQEGSLIASRRMYRQTSSTRKPAIRYSPGRRFRCSRNGEISIWRSAAWMKRSTTKQTS